LPVTWSRPEFSMHHALLVGDFDYMDSHLNTFLRTPTQPYTELGLIIESLIRIKYAGAAYLGLGGGIFYNYGYHAKEKHMENITLKIAFSLRL
jgi:hypothetical protein